MNVQIQSQNGDIRTLSASAVERFRNTIWGEVVTPDAAGYDAARTLWNGMIDKKPAMIVQCGGATDVKTAVKFARENHLLISMRGGGHNVSGAALADNAFVIDLSRMRGVQVDPDRRIATVDGGARLGDVDRKTQEYGLATPLGVVSETGVGGLVLHGGTGWLTRKHGLSIDNLISLDIVTADGRVRTVNRFEYPELFWAVRGGGGNFGVVTSFRFKLHPVGPKVWMTVPIYPLDRAGEVLERARAYMETAPEDYMLIGVFWSAPDVTEVPAKWRGMPVLILLGCYTGPFGEGERIVQTIRGFGEPIADLTAPMSWVEAQQFLDEDYPDGAFYYWTSLYPDRLDPDAIAALTEHAAARPSPLSSIDVWFLGGAASRVKPADTPFFRRGAKYMIGIEANFQKKEDAGTNIEWARSLYEDGRFSRSGVYLNFPGFMEDRDALLHAAYGQNLERLRSIKAKYDPDNFFPGVLNIRPD